VEYLRLLYHGTYSIDHLAQAVRGCLSVNSRELGSARGETERRRLLSVRADGALLAGRLALFDAWEPIAARGYLAMAREAAAEAGDDALAAAVCGHLAFVPAREHLLRASAEYLAAARRHADRSGLPTLRSWVAAVEAELLGPARGDRGLRALDRAVEAMSGAAAAPTPPWFDFYSPARLEGFRGQVLVAAGRGAAAREALTRALGGLEPDAVQQRAVLLADVAASSLCEPAPDIDQVAAEALHAATELGRTGYAAAAERLAAVRARLDPWRDAPAVRSLDDALASSVA
jgi:hypothetical protein